MAPCAGLLSLLTLDKKWVDKLTGEGSTNRAVLAEHTRSAARLFGTRGGLRVDQNNH